MRSKEIRIHHKDLGKDNHALILEQSWPVYEERGWEKVPVTKKESERTRAATAQPE